MLDFQEANLLVLPCQKPFGVKLPGETKGMLPQCVPLFFVSAAIAVYSCYNLLAQG